MFCKFCGTMIPDGSVFCGVCGRPMGQVDITNTQPQQQYVQQPQQQYVQQLQQPQYPVKRKGSPVLIILIILTALMTVYLIGYFLFAMLLAKTDVQKVATGTGIEHNIVTGLEGFIQEREDTVYGM
ncbi:MAG: zinc ribbon domain-containing protein [Lachnospiraceae bacterium]|nr:zinc ribbon domain-containing protein [Lachnospiraceae bacterium]